MIKLEHTEVYGFGSAIRGMRNPKNSWDKSDSRPLWNEDDREWDYIIGENDKKLMKTLSKAGNDHAKFLRMINVTVDITAPLYWVAEHDTYKVGTVRNSCSFMHKGVSKPFEINDFSVQDERIYYLLNSIEKDTHELIYPYDKNKLHLAYNSWKNGHCIVLPEIKSRIKYDYRKGLTPTELSEKYELPEKTINNIVFIKPCDNDELFMSAYTWEKTIEQLNKLRELYLETKDEFVFKEIRQILPQGYNVRYTWQGNYQVLKSMYFARKDHRLDEWHTLCDWMLTLPYFKEICVEN